jgi:hypothetical protein
VASDAKRIEIGFEGGQVVSVRLDESALSALRQGVERGQGWHDLQSDEGAFALDLAKVVFVRAAGGSHSIGFAGD